MSESVYIVVLCFFALAAYRVIAAKYRQEERLTRMARNRAWHHARRPGHLPCEAPHQPGAFCSPACRTNRGSSVARVALLATPSKPMVAQHSAGVRSGQVRRGPGADLEGRQNRNARLADAKRAGCNWVSYSRPRTM